MNSLIEAGHVYIAQPPLYKVSKGKREEYIETEEEMNEFILDSGIEGVKLSKIKGKTQYTNGQFKNILGSLVDLERLIEIMKKRGVGFEEYIDNYDGNPKQMPLYKVKVEQDTHFVYNDKELASLTKKDEEAQYIEILETEDIAEIEKALQKAGLSIVNFWAIEKKPDKKKKAKTTKKSSKKEEILKPLFAIEGDKDKHEFFCLKEVLNFIRGQARKGIHIQRYKGLGEMNPQQLWDTTMEPHRRTILQVALEDAVEVDKTFTMLMGDEVAPRREFIQSNAHEVKNLDI